MSEHTNAELARTVAALWACEECFSLLFDQHCDIMLIVDPLAGRIVDANKAAAAFYGYSREELRGMAVQRISCLPEKDIRTLLCQVQQQSRNCIVLPHRKADGTVRTVEVHPTPVVFHEQPLIFAVVTDITERRVRDAERDLSYRLFSNSSDLMCITGPDGRFRQMNPAGLAMLGYGEREIIGHSYAEFVVPEDLLRTDDEVGRHQGGGVTSNFENRYRRRDGSICWLSWRGVWDSDGTCYATARDITLHKAALLALQESQQRLSAYIDTSPMATIEWDANFVVTRWAGEAERIFGWHAGEMLGKPIMELQIIHDADIDLVKSAMEKLSDPTAKHVYTTNRNYTKDGRVIVCEWYNSILRDGQGTMSSILSQVLDVTERVDAEEALAVKQQQLEELNRSLEQRIDTAINELRQRDHLLVSQNRLAAMGEMVSSIAHQWRQPLNNIGLVLQSTSLAYSQGALEPDQFRERVAQCMGIIQAMSQTINDFGRFFKPDTEKRSFRVVEAVQRAVDIVRANLRNRRIVLEVFDEGAGNVTGYPNEYAQVVLALLNNARDILTERETEEGRIELRCRQCGDKTVVTLWDNGGGIDPAILPKIFDPYFTTKQPSQGRGMGLYMAKMIIEQNMAGRLTARNVNGGAEFEIEV